MVSRTPAGAHRCPTQTTGELLSALIRPLRPADLESRFPCPRPRRFMVAILQLDDKNSNNFIRTRFIISVAILCPQRRPILSVGTPTNHPVEMRRIVALDRTFSLVPTAICLPMSFNLRVPKFVRTRTLHTIGTQMGYGPTHCILFTGRKAAIDHVGQHHGGLELWVWTKTQAPALSKHQRPEYFPRHPGSLASHCKSTEAHLVPSKHHANRKAERCAHHWIRET